MALCSTLSRIQKSMVDFDPYNPEHIKAFEMLCLGDKGVIRQHPTLRFHLDDTFPDVRSMMFHAVGRKFSHQVLSREWLENLQGGD